MAKNNTCLACHQAIDIVEEALPKYCPHCGVSYWHKPGDERALFQYQETFLETRDPEILGKMFVILKRYAKNMIKKRIRNNGGRGIQSERLDEIGYEAAYEFIDYYFKNQNFKIGDSFGGYMNLYLGGLMNPTDSYAARSAFSLDEQFDAESQTTAVTRLDRPLAQPSVCSTRTDWQEALIVRPKHETDKNVSNSELDEIVTRIDEKVFYYQGWAASMLFAVSLCSKLRDRRATRKIGHLQLQYSKIPILENIEKTELMLRTVMVEGF